MNQEEFTPFPEIVSELERLCREKRTGVLFLATKANRSAQIMLDEGEIVFLYFFNKRGREALQLMAEISAGRFRFQEGSIIAKRMDLPSTADILRFLAGQEVDDKQQTGTGGKSAGSQKGIRASGGIVALTDAQRSLLEESLASFIGPMASIICEEHLDTVSDVVAAVEALAAEIPSENQAAQFRTEVLEKLH